MITIVKQDSVLLGTFVSQYRTHLSVVPVRSEWAMIFIHQLLFVVGSGLLSGYHFCTTSDTLMHGLSIPWKVGKAISEELQVPEVRSSQQIWEW